MLLRKETSPRINYALLVLCYLEVVLWTACLLSSSSAATSGDSIAGHTYLQRETGNLKCFAKTPSVPLFDELQLQADLHTELEHIYQQQQFETLSELACSAQPSAELEQLRALLLLEEKGLPAPFTGIAAID